MWDAFHDTAQPTFLEGLPELPAPEPPTEPPSPPAEPVDPPPGIPPIPAPAPQQPSLLPLPTDPPQEPAPPVVEPEPEPEPVEPLTFKLDEVWQVAILRTSRRAYHGRENVRPTDERTQARIYGELVRQMSCDASVGEAFLRPRGRGEPRPLAGGARARRPNAPAGVGSGQAALRTLRTAARGVPARGSTPSA